MKKSTLVGGFFIKVTSINSCFVNNKGAISYLQNDSFFCFKQLLINF